MQAGAEPLIDGDVELKSVTFAYPTRPGRLIFKQFNLKVQAGSSCALVSSLWYLKLTNALLTSLPMLRQQVGESGHGKSTIIGLLERFYDPVDGQVRHAASGLEHWGHRLKRLHVCSTCITDFD